MSLKWGVAPPPRFALVAQPPTNGVPQRFNPPPKGKVIPSRVLQNPGGVRSVVTEFKKPYKSHWRLEKPGFPPPPQAPQAHTLPEAA